MQDHHGARAADSGYIRRWLRRDNPGPGFPRGPCRMPHACDRKGILPSGVIVTGGLAACPPQKASPPP